MRLLQIIILSSIVFFSCNTAVKKTKNTYFGGQIINPKSNYISLLDGHRLIKKIELDENNSFLVELDSINEGLYTFMHGSFSSGHEFQYIYIEPQDSILIRINTWDFDESLMFSGKGAEKNNFLSNLFLKNEKTEWTFNKNYALNVDAFLDKINQIKNKNDLLYQELKNSEVKLTDEFEELANIAMNYGNLRRLEMYPFNNKRLHKTKKYPTLPENFYDFRNEINLNNAKFISFFPYTNYINSYLYSEAQMEKENTEHNDFTENLLNKIVEYIHIEPFKSNLLYEAIYNDFKGAQSTCAINDKALEVFRANCINQEFIDKINKLNIDCENIKPNKPLSDFDIITPQGKKSKITEIIQNRKVVIYFWSPKYINADILIKKVIDLEQKHPKLKFIGVNMNPDINSTSKTANTYSQHLYKLAKESTANSFLTSRELRTILVNANGIITNSFTYLSSNHLEKELLKLENL